MSTGAEPRKKTGRPRAFVHEGALEAAMRVFWEKGYEGTSIGDLTCAMGINRSSLYTIYGDKDAIFRQVLLRYQEGPAFYLQQALQEPTSRRVIESLLRGAADLLTNPSNPKGCLVTQAALAVGKGAESAKQALTAFRQTSEDALVERFVKAQCTGDLPLKTDPGDLARYVLTFLAGLGVQGIDGTTKEQIDAISTMLLQSLPCDP